MCPGEMRREAYFPIFIKALQKGGHMNQYLEQWVGKELTKELEEGIINEVGGMKEALAKLHQMIDAGIK